MQIKPVDLMSIDDLFGHIDEHFQEGNDIFEFYCLHFGKDATKHIPQDCEHNQLPFHHQFDQNQIFLALTFSQNSEEELTFSSQLTDTSFHYKNLYSSINIFKIIQPPIF